MFSHNRMTNTSEEITNSTLILPTPSKFTNCAQGINLGLIVLYCAMTFCFLFGTPGNLWCLWFYFCIQRKFNQSRVFLLNYIIIDLIFCIACAAEMLNLFIFENYTLTMVIYFYSWMFWNERPLIQTCICIEQYLAVLYPVRFLKYKGIKYRIAATVAVWFISFVYVLHQLIKMTFFNLFNNLVFVITLAVSSFCCVSVLHALKHPVPGATHTRNEAGRDVRNQQKRNAFNTIFSALLLMLFSYIPQTLFIVCTGFKIDQTLFECNISPIFTSCNVFGIMVTPFLNVYKEYHLKCLKYQKK